MIARIGDDGDVSWTKRRGNPVGGWNTRVQLVNPRPPAVPVGLDIKIEEYFAAAGAIRITVRAARRARSGMGGALVARISARRWAALARSKRQETLKRKISR
jgi:hypothetical protein